MSKKEKFFNNENDETKSEVIDVDYDVVESGIEQFEPEQIIGIVSNCKRLNIRRNPNIKADIVCDVPVGSKLTIYSDKSTEEWLSVHTEFGIDGYCMKEFVTINQ